MARLLHKPYVNEVTLREHNPSLKCCYPLDFSNSYFSTFRTFNAVNIGSVGQRAAKLRSVKVGSLKKKSAIRPWPHSNRSARIRERPGSNHSQSLMAGNFAAL